MRDSQGFFALFLPFFSKFEIISKINNEKFSGGDTLIQFMNFGFWFREKTAILRKLGKSEYGQSIK